MSFAVLVSEIGRYEGVESIVHGCGCLDSTLHIYMSVFVFVFIFPSRVWVFSLVYDSTFGEKGVVFIVFYTLWDIVGMKGA